MLIVYEVYKPSSSSHFGFINIMSQYVYWVNLSGQKKAYND